MAPLAVLLGGTPGQAKDEEVNERECVIEEGKRTIAAREHEAREQQRRYEALREESEALQKELQRRQLLCQQKDTEIEALRRTVNDAEREKTEQAQALTKQEEELSKHAALAQLIHQLSGAKGPDVKSILGQKDLNVLGAEGQQGGSA